MKASKLLLKKDSSGKLKIHKKTDEEQKDLPLDNAKAAAKKQTKLKSLVGKQIIGNTKVEKTNETEKTTSEEVGESYAKDNEPMANVGYSLARTHNLGNYESIRIQVDLHVPSKVDESEIEDNYTFAKGWCEEKMVEIMEEYEIENG